MRKFREIVVAGFLLLAGTGVAQACGSTTGSDCSMGWNLRDFRGSSTSHTYLFNFTDGYTLASLSIDASLRSIDRDRESDSWSLVASSGSSEVTIFSGSKDNASTRAFSLDSLMGDIISTGRMVITLFETSGKTYHVSLASTVNANCKAVPLPAAAYLFVGGMTLFGWVGVRRRSPASLVA